MITGIHFLFYSADPEADRAFFRDVLGFRAIDAGGGWLIYRLPPAELAVHPHDGAAVQRHAEQRLLDAVPYLMCDDLKAEIAGLAARGVTCASVEEEKWGLVTSVPLPGGGRIGLYQPFHPVP